MTRDQLVDAIVEFLAPRDLLLLADVRAALNEEIDGAGPDALMALRERLTLDRGWAYYPADPLARRIHNLLADRFLQPGSSVQGLESLARVTQSPLVFVGNHLSYADANAVAVLLHRAGAASLAERLTALAGPKVFSDRRRRFSSLCFGTVKVPQSAEVSSEDAVLNPREVARAARQAIAVAAQRLEAGDALLLFAEGTRSRSGAMNPMLAGASRYFEGPGTWVVPLGITGPEQLFPVDASTTQPACVQVRIGEPIQASALFTRAGADRKRVIDAIGSAVAELLPSQYRGVYGSSGTAAQDEIHDRTNQNRTRRRPATSPCRPC
jgi:1-acyl-sn-glycerol-3-phosphate acyltransferase